MSGVVVTVWRPASRLPAGVDLDRFDQSQQGSSSQRYAETGGAADGPSRHGPCRRYARPVDEDLKTRALRREQERREHTERSRAEVAGADDADQHARRAEKAEYLKRKLEQRAEAERNAAVEDE